MKRHWKIAIAGAALIAIVAAIDLTGLEPEYKGRTLSEWVWAARDGYTDDQSREAAQVLREMCPTALPTLVDWISYEKSDQARRMEDFVWQIADKFGLGAKFDLITRKGEERLMTAFDAFRILGTNAAPAIPQLSNMVMNANRPDAAANALQALASTGTPGIQTIISLLHNRDNPNAPATLASLTLYDQNAPDLVMAAIREQLTNPDPKMRTTAINALAEVRKAEAVRKAASQRR